MNTNFIKKIKQQLLLEKETLLSKPPISTELQAVDMDGDEIDEIQGKQLIELNKQLNARTQVKCLKIDDALRRIDTKTYGICEDCEEQIPEKRLIHNPYFLTCISCAENREIEEKQRKRA